MYEALIMCQALPLVLEDTNGEDLEDEFVLEELIFYRQSDHHTLSRKRLSDAQGTLIKPECLMGETNTLDFSVRCVAILR